MILKKAVISLFCIFITLFMFIFIIRLKQGKNGFIGLNDLFSYFSSVDMNKPISRFSNDISNLSKAWQSFDKGDGQPTIIQGTFSQIWQDLPASQEFDLSNNDFFKVINVIAETITFPFRLIGDFILMLVDYISIFNGFISWIVTFEGYVPSV